MNSCRKVRNFMVIYSDRILNRKNVLLVVLVFFLISIYLDPVKRFSVIANESISPWIQPFLLTDTNFLILFMVAVIYYFSNVPFTNRWNGYYLLRSGKERWIKEQIAYIMVSAFVIALISIILTWISLFPRLKMERGWGKVLFTLAQTDANKKCGLFWKISAQYISKHTPFEAMLMCIFIMALGITFLGLIMFAFSLFRPSFISVAIATAVVVYSYLPVAMGDSMQKELSMISPISWMRIADFNVTRYGNEIAPNVSYVICAYVLLILMLICLIRIRLRKADFIWNDKEE